MNKHVFRNFFFSLIDKIFGIERGAFIEISLMSYVKFSRFYKRTSSKTSIDVPKVISMADEVYSIGGLADRLRSIVSIFSFCETHHIKFGIYFTTPFNLEDYLIPNRYNWRVDNISRNCSYSKAVIIEEHSSHRGNINNIKNNLLEHFLLDQSREIHCYSNINIDIDSENFSIMFQKLFKPSTKLDKELEKHICNLGDTYISISFRFVQLLGDFYDCIDTILPKDEQNILINKCIDVISDLHNQNPTYNILVTSDSSKFCIFAKELPYVYIAPGDIVHTNYSSSNDDHMKTFVDFMLIAKAKKAYLARTEYMFKSGFARIAAKAGNVPFEEIHIK